MSESNSSAMQYQASCHDCRYSRYFGVAKLTAHVKGTSHAFRKMHTVDIGQIDLTKLEPTVIETISPRSAQAGITESDDPPF